MSPLDLSPPAASSSNLGTSNNRLRRRLCRVLPLRSSRLTIPRASDLKGHGPASEEWRPPSDWDKAFKAYKKLSHVPPPSAIRGPGGDEAPSSNQPSGRGQARSKAPHFQSPLRHMEAYVSRSPDHSNYPLAEEPDALRRSERQLLCAWTGMSFTYAGFGVIAAMLVVMVLFVGPPPPV